MSVTEHIKKLQKHETDQGSTGVQIARILNRIKTLSDAHFKIHPKDKHSKYGLTMMVSRLRKLIKYMQETDPSGYQVVKSTLGLRR